MSMPYVFVTPPDSKSDVINSITQSYLVQKFF